MAKQFEYSIGDLRSRLTIQEETGFAQSSTGQPTPTFTDRGTIWAGIKPLQPYAVEIARGFAATVNYIITVRFNSKINSKCKLVHSDGREFIVNGCPDPDNRRRWMQCYCTLEI